MSAAPGSGGDEDRLGPTLTARNEDGVFEVEIGEEAFVVSDLDRARERAAEFDYVVVLGSTEGMEDDGPLAEKLLTADDRPVDVEEGVLIASDRRARFHKGYGKGATEEIEITVGAAATEAKLAEEAALPQKIMAPVAVLEEISQDE